MWTAVVFQVCGSPSWRSAISEQVVARGMSSRFAPAFLWSPGMVASEICEGCGQIGIDRPIDSEAADIKRSAIPDPLRARQPASRPVNRLPPSKRH